MPVASPKFQEELDVRRNHENSVTIRRGRRWVNVNGHTGKALDPIWSFESADYGSLARALFAARRRSQMFGLAANTKRGRLG